VNELTKSYGLVANVNAILGLRYEIQPTFRFCPFFSSKKELKKNSTEIKKYGGTWTTRKIIVVIKPQNIL
jgi:hypothetical protein